MTVLVDGYEYGLCDLEKGNIRSVRFNRDVNDCSWAGPHKQDSDGEFAGVVIGR